MHVITRVQVRLKEIPEMRERRKRYSRSLKRRVYLSYITWLYNISALDICGRMIIRAVVHMMKFLLPVASHS